MESLNEVVMKRITTTIKRPYLAAIIARTKKVEYRQAKRYWRDRLDKVTVPFTLRLINGMQKNAPEAILLIRRVRKVKGVYELHIGKVINFKNWDKKKGRPTPRAIRSARRAA